MKKPAWQLAACAAVVAGGIVLALLLTRGGGGDGGAGPAAAPPPAGGGAQVPGDKSAANGTSAVAPGPTPAGPEIRLDPDTQKAAGLRVESAGPAPIRSLLRVYGKINANDDVQVSVSPRFPGIVRKVNRGLGDLVTADEVLAVVESNESLRTYELRPGLAGTITNKAVSPGQFVSPQDVLFTVTDLTSVFVDLTIPRADFNRLAVGQKVRIFLDDGGAPVDNKIDYLSPFSSESTQSLLARVVAPNPDGRVRPGLYITAEIILDEHLAPVTVRASALQTIDGRANVFVREAPGLFRPRPVETGGEDRGVVEIRQGLRAGEAYVTENSFTLKSEVGKSSLNSD